MQAGEPVVVQGQYRWECGGGEQLQQRVTGGDDELLGRIGRGSQPLLSELRPGCQPQSPQGVRGSNEHGSALYAAVVPNDHAHGVQRGHPAQIGHRLAGGLWFARARSLKQGGDQRRVGFCIRDNQRAESDEIRPLSDELL